MQTKGSYFSETQFRKWNISKDDRYLLPDQNDLSELLGFEPAAQGNKLPVYHFPATKEVIEKIKKSPIVNAVRIEPAQIGINDLGGPVFTLSDEIAWTRDNFGPLWIPRKGAVIELNPRNVLLYGRAIRAYERHNLEERQGRYFIDGKPAEQYTFEMDYYWMMGDNRHNSADSRAWGFVPEDHVVGKPMRVWLSLDKDRNWFQGKIRWKRFMKKAV